MKNEGDLTGEYSLLEWRPYEDLLKRPVYLGKPETEAALIRYGVDCLPTGRLTLLSGEPSASTLPGPG